MHLVDEPQAEDPSGALAPYFPDYFGGTATTVIQLVVFHAFLLVFAIKLVKWAGRTWFMGHTFFKTKEIRVANYEQDKGGTVSVGWPDQLGATAKKSFRDWCWPSVPTVGTPFQKWIDDVSGQLDGLRNERLLMLHDHQRSNYLEVLGTIISNISLVLDYDDGKGNQLSKMGANSRVLDEIEAMKHQLDYLHNNMEDIISSFNLSNDEKIAACSEFTRQISLMGNKLREIAQHGRAPQFDVTGY